MVYLWEIPENYPETLIGDYQRVGTPDRFMFLDGKVLSKNIGLPVVKFNATIKRLQKFGCLANNAMVPLVSPTCAAVLMSLAPSDVQLIKTQVVGSDGLTDYFSLLNVTCSVTCIDRDRSVFKNFPGTDHIMLFRKLYFSDGCMGVHGLARNSEYLGQLLVSETVAEHLKRAHLLGLRVVVPEDVAW